MLKRPIFVHKDVSKRNNVFLDFDFIDTNTILIKSWIDREHVEN